MAQRQFLTSDTSPWIERYSDGSAGALTVSADLADASRTGYSVTTITGTATETAATAGAVGNFVAGDTILIHQTQKATGAGVWELNKISSTGAGTNWTLSYALMNTYAAKSQVYRLVKYSSVTINSTKTLTGTAWNGTTGGIVALLCNGTITITGTINAGSGFGGGTGNNNKGIWGDTGEGTVGASVANSGSANGNGGAGGKSGSTSSGGGGNGTEGTSPSGTAGNASLTSMAFGGGGGGEGMDNPTDNTGFAGKGIVILIGKTITVTGTINSTAVTGPVNASAGAGGSILLKGQTLTLGTALVTATGGASGGRGAGGDGRIHADYSGSISGTTTPTIDTTVDSILADLPTDTGYAYFM